MPRLPGSKRTTPKQMQHRKRTNGRYCRGSGAAPLFLNPKPVIRINKRGLPSQRKGRQRRENKRFGKVREGRVGMGERKKSDRSEPHRFRVPKKDSRAQKRDPQDEKTKRNTRQDRPKVLTRLINRVSNTSPSRSNEDRARREKIVRVLRRPRKENGKRS